MTLPYSRNETYVDGTTLIPAQTMNDIQDYIAGLYSYFPIFGDGSDGNVTVSTTVTLTRDMYYNNLTISSGGILAAAGYRIFVRGTLTTSGGGYVHNSGANGVTTNGGAGAGAGTVFGGGAGANSLVPNSNGLAGTSISSNSLGGAGGAGGAAPSTYTGGAAGTVTALAANRGGYRIVAPGVAGYVLGRDGSGNAALTGITGGAGGGSGGSTSSGGGAGGGGGGVLVLYARTISVANATDILAKGGNGAGSADGSDGGGGGGGGGVLFLTYVTKNGVTFSSATNCAGGTAGAAPSGHPGAAGSNGTLIQISLSA